MNPSPRFGNRCKSPASAAENHANKATVLRAVTDDYLRRSGLDITVDHGVDNMAMATSLVASTRGLALMPAYARNLLPDSVVCRPLQGEAPTIDIAVGYSKTNTSPTQAVPFAARGTGAAEPAALISRSTSPPGATALTANE